MSELARELASKDRLALLLDFDGTLAEIVPRPEDARPHPDALAALARLVRDRGVHVALISGRAVDSLRARMPLAGAWYAGSHGAELVTPQGLREPLVPFARARPSIASFLAHAQALVGILGSLVEDKGAAGCAHFRTLPPEVVPARASSVRAHAVAVTSGPDAEPLEGKQVIEVRARDAKKGTAARALLDRFGDTVPVAVGDDATDEDLLALAQERGGVAIKVGPGPSVARHRLADPSDVARFLVALASARS